MGVGWGSEPPRRRRRGIRQGCRASLRAPSKNGRGGGAPCRGQGGRVPGPTSYQEHSGRVEGRLAGKGAPSGICARATAARDSSVRGVTLSFASRGRSGSYSRPPSPSPSASLAPAAQSRRDTPERFCSKGAQCGRMELGLSPEAGRVDAGCALPAMPLAGVQALHRGGEGSAPNRLQAWALGLGQNAQEVCSGRLRVAKTELAAGYLENKAFA